MSFKAFGILLTVFFLAFTACKKSDELPSNNFNQLENNGATMPVYMHGDKNSDVAIIVVHGGPGESGILKRAAVGLYRLEEEHLMVYYDQRASGITEGNVDPESLTISQLADDLNAVVELVDEVTNATKFFIVSLDWGGAIAASYLASSDLNPNVKGYVASSPSFNSNRNMFAMRDTLQELSTALAPTLPEVATNLQNFLNQNFLVTQFNYAEYYRVVEQLAGINFNTEFAKSPAQLPAYINRSLENNRQFVMENLRYEEHHFLSLMNLEPLLPQIPVPTKLIWGKHDLLFPVSLAREYDELLGNASDAEQLSIFNNSAHQPYFEEGDRFYAVVATWVSLFD